MYMVILEQWRKALGHPSEADSDINATFMTEGARVNSSLDGNGGSIFVNNPKANWVNAHTHYALLYQIVDYGDIKCTLPAMTEVVLADRMQLSRLEVHFHAIQHNPGVETGTSNEGVHRG